MMELLVFLVILFGLFGVVATQYINQYRSAYHIWIREMIFVGGARTENLDEKLDLCSKIESYSRELCEITDMLFILLYMVYVTLAVIIISTAFTLHYLNFDIHTDFTTLSNDTKISIIQTVAPLALTLVILIATPILFSFLKLDILNPSRSSSIDKMLFDLWWKKKCHRCKNEKNKKNMQPVRLYELLDENIKNRTINDYTDNEKELVKDLTKKKDVNVSP